MDGHVDLALRSFTDAAQAAFGETLRSVVLFGSAAEDRLRPVSDVNVLLVLRSFDPARAERLRDELRLARAAVDLRPTFVLEDEIPAATELFSVKFGDVLRRHRVLLGDDPFTGSGASRAARIASLRRVLLNVTMRLRERFATVGDEGHAAVLAEFTSAVRAAAAEWLSLHDGTSLPPREALARAAKDLGDAADAASVATLSVVREGGDVPPAEARAALLSLISLSGRLASAVRGLAP